MTPVILAAGSSVRFGPQDKLEAIFHQQSLLKHAHDSAIVLGDPVVLKTKTSAMGDTIAQISEVTSGSIALFLGDMPLIQHKTVLALHRAFCTLKGNRIVRPVFGADIGFPIFIPANLTPKLANLKGKVRGLSFVHRYMDRLTFLPVQDQGVITDIDTPEQLDALSRENWAIQALNIKF